MASRRVEDAPAPARRRPGAPAVRVPEAGPPRSVRDLLLHSWPGRLFIIATAVKLAVGALRLVVEPPRFVNALSTTATVALLVALGYFAGRLFLLMRRQLLWRVRRKLILSFIFVGVVPALLIVAFGVLGAWMISMNVSAFLFRDGYDEIVRNAAAIADAAVAEIVRNPKDVTGTITRVQQNGSIALNYTALSMAFIDARGDPAARVVTGPWDHEPAPGAIPTWVKTRGDGFIGSVAIPHPDRPGRLELVARAIRPAATVRGMIGYVVVDIPVDGTLIDQLYDKTRVRVGVVELTGTKGDIASESVTALTRSDPDAPGDLGLFDRSVAFFDVSDWPTGEPVRATASLRYRLGELYGRIMEAQSGFRSPGSSPARTFLYILLFLAGLFFIIQAAALTMGLVLARSITSSIHELFMGTERVRHGDFGHRIEIHTKDQLGELADSFNQMTGSIENLLQTAAEKKRLEEELRIARQIQMSLLPRGPLDMPGLGVTALCVPAREVGGDYYDFFPLGDGRLGVLIADVSGKGTSAALYMAELKGIVLSLSQIYQSPRQLLLEVNRIISANLDTRSFITMTYAVIDLPSGILTFARAGHTPLIHLPARGAQRGTARIVTPNGLVVGLRIDGAEEKFAELLEEQQIALHPGDVIVLYTDGITEAMNGASDLFGESRLSRLVEEHGHLPSGELRERILREIEAFVGPADQHDDMTMILIKIERAEAARVAV